MKSLALAFKAGQVSRLAQPRDIFVHSAYRSNGIMKKLCVSSFCLLLLSGFLLAQSTVDPLPDPVSNNAVAMLKVHGQLPFSERGIVPCSNSYIIVGQVPDLPS